MVRVDIETIIMASGNIPSVIVLRERSSSAASDSPLRALSIQTGSYEAAAISQGIGGEKRARPITHDLFTNTLKELHAKVSRVEITRVDSPLFYASLVFSDGEGTEHVVDARPSDAIAMAVRSNAPIYVEDDVMNRAANISFPAEKDDEAEFELFDRFVQTLSPDDF